MADAAPLKSDATRLAIINEARVAFKSKDYKKAENVLTTKYEDVLWTVDPIYIQRQRLLGQTLLRLKQYGDADIANISAFMLDPTLLDVLYDTACSSALQNRLPEALKNLEILWHQVSDNPTQKKRYFQLLNKDPDLAKLAKNDRFKTIQQAFAGSGRLSGLAYSTQPSVFSAIGDDIDSGYPSHQILGTLMCGKEAGVGFRGIRITAPKEVELKKEHNGSWQFHLPICFEYMMFSKDIATKTTQKKKPDLAWIIELADSKGQIIKGTYQGIQNSKDHRTGAVIEHPAEQPGDDGSSLSVEGSASDSGTGGREITDVSWHLKSVLTKSETFKIRLYNDVYESNTVTVKFRLDPK